MLTSKCKSSGRTMMRSMLKQFSELKANGTMKYQNILFNLH